VTDPTWRSNDRPPAAATGFGRVRAALRAAALAVLVFGGLAILLLVRLIERPAFGRRRAVTPHITRAVCVGALRIVGLARTTRGTPSRAGGAIVANHASWLDIFVLNAGQPVTFVAKSEVAAWPGIGWLARATGTLFIRRDRHAARDHIAAIRDRLIAGQRLVFFPEGTSTDGLRVLPFKTTLFAAFLDPAMPADLTVQPVTLRYVAPDGADARLYGWWGDMAFAPHLLATLAAPRQGRVEVTYHPPIAIADHPDRKTLARAAETAVRSAF